MTLLVTLILPILYTIGHARAWVYNHLHLLFFQRLILYLSISAFLDSIAFLMVSLFTRSYTIYD